MIIRSPEPEVKIIVDRDPVKTPSEEWATPGHFSNSPFWGPKAISMVVEPQGVLICWSSRHAVWADSGPFLGLLLSFGVSK